MTHVQIILAKEVFIMYKKFTPEYQAQLIDAWKKFIHYEDADYSLIRPEILESWNRSRAAGVSPHNTAAKILSSDELTIRINSNLDLIEVVRPYMEKLYSIVQGSGFYLLFCDKDGYILDLIGDRSIIEHGKNKSMLVVGANRQESSAGTNAIGTCLALQKPIQIWGAEHYLEAHKGYVCSGAPFFDSSGNILGCLNITGLSENVHPHTLGLVISAVDGITKEVKIRKAYADIELISAQRNSIIQSMTFGLFLLNKSARIIQVNDAALQMLDLKYDNIIGKSIFDFISFDENNDRDRNFSLIENEVYNKEMNIHQVGSASPPIRFNMSVNFVKDSNGRYSGTVIRFNQPRVINNLVNTISGYKSKYTFDSIIGDSPVTRELIETCKCAAQSSSNVLIIGKSGTGKELIAQSMHNMSPFSSGPFVAINCAALPKGLVESELFGYEKGAFTGAGKSGNPGKFELADGGTIFLDEIGDMPLDVQVSLLRVIQTKEIVRVGGKYPKAVNVRIIAATNKDLNQAIEEKTFREDLYYRLNVLNIQVPTLAERGNDVCQLADYFVKLYGSHRGIKINPSVYTLLRKYNWPGNIRQLENVIERAVNITDTNLIEPAHLPLEIQQADPVEGSASPLSSERMAASASSLSRPHGPKDINSENVILDGLEKCGGNVTEAAKFLGVSRRTLYRKLDKYNIDYGKYRNR